MKKIFSEKMASVYGWLLVLSLVGLGIAVVVIVSLALSSWPVSTMPISSAPRPLFFASMIFGALAIMSYWKVNIPTLMALVTTSILLTVMFNSFSKVFSHPYGEKENVVVESRWKRDYNLGYGVVVVESICISNGHLIDVYNGTKVYEQDRISQQKRRVELGTLQPGQVVNITFSSFKDDEFYELLRESSPYGPGVTIWEGAAEITIRKGEYGPVDSQTGDSLCEILFQE